MDAKCPSVERIVGVCIRPIKKFPPNPRALADAGQFSTIARLISYTIFRLDWHEVASWHEVPSSAECGESSPHFGGGAH